MTPSRPSFLARRPGRKLDGDWQTAALLAAFTAGGLAVSLALAFSGQALAQSYPSRPITMIVPAAAGGPTDAIARVITERMRVSLGQPIIIENVPGATGTIGIGRVARAVPDGLTIGIGQSSNYVVNGAIFKLPYDLRTDFKPIALLSSAPQVIIARKTLPANNLGELIAWLKANSDKATAASGGIGSPPHVFGLEFENVTETQFQFVPHRGGGPALQSVVAGQIDIMIDLAANSLPQLRAGTVKTYAVTAKSRLAAAPDLPTVDEAGLPGFYASVWHAIWVPKGTPNDIVVRLNAAVVDALADPMVRQRLTALGQEIFPREQQTPEALGALHRAEIEKWWPIIKASGITAE
jgi:tripartite-type tricarboxylate transporter receptor subunit TctC